MPPVNKNFRLQLSTMHSCVIIRASPNWVIVGIYILFYGLLWIYPMPNQCLYTVFKLTSTKAIVSSYHYTSILATVADDQYDILSDWGDSWNILPSTFVPYYHQHHHGRTQQNFWRNPLNVSAETSIFRPDSAWTLKEEYCTGCKITNI